MAPSPVMQTTWRPGLATWAPRAWETPAPSIPILGVVTMVLKARTSW